MKTKLTLFVAALAAALFVGGCASADRTNKAEVNSKLTGDPLRKGLVAYYPFNENAMDESGRGNHGEVKGANLGADRHGETNRAYSFDGEDDYIDLGNKPEFNFGKGDFTLSFWVRGSQIGNKYLIAKYKYENKPGYGIGTKVEGNCAYAFIWDKGEGYYIATWGGKVPIDGNWHHIVAPYDRDAELIIYVDGEVAAKVNISSKSDSVDNSLNLTIGKQSGGQNFSGSIDDIRLYNRALSAEEVKALYDLEKPKGK